MFCILLSLQVFSYISQRVLTQQGIVYGQVGTNIERGVIAVYTYKINCYILIKMFIILSVIGTMYTDLMDVRTMLRTTVYEKLTREEAMPVDHLISSVLENILVDN